MRAAIRDAIASAPVHSQVEVAAYLDALERRALNQHVVTALEVEPGIAIIKRYVPEPEPEIERFSQRMLKIQRGFEAARERIQPVPEESEQGSNDY